MAEIDMPGDEVARVRDLLGRVMELVETKASGFNAADVGPPLERSGDNFDKKWNDGRFQLKRNGKVLRDACEAIVKAFEDADRDMGQQLKEGNGQ
ncbi:hypothetical protein [Streptomyces sp. GQFP]|uniref:hypothetical protein n=1 Tax=Streptomyces sp. GQFP TaxID=2907545 RepID=UPI001F2252EB|nr:hypothetical protein [Streptomyces sp. GQFP]UIX31052.1 hypothetical protein LUX31_13985 [Streptomyces sp. GQFP]